MISTARIERQLKDLKAQASYLEEQLVMTMGAIQVLEHLLAEGEGAAALPPEVEGNDDEGPLGGRR